jgi:4-hydroxyphenylpyruvate dioxygenase
MPPEEFLSWQLYYTSLLAVERMPAVDIPDPSGLVQSQAIQSADGKVRFTLNGGGGQTLASRFVHAYFGAGVQHVAFETADIFATAEGLKRNGVALLPLPANYYEDLGARFGLDEALLARLADLSILYDRDAFGDYFQVYARAFHKRFFFEVVQRDAYQGYGAANAPARLAAQARAGAAPSAFAP